MSVLTDEDMETLLVPLLEKLSASDDLEDMMCAGNISLAIAALGCGQSLKMFISIQNWDFAKAFSDSNGDVNKLTKWLNRHNRN